MEHRSRPSSYQSPDPQLDMATPQLYLITNDDEFSVLYQKLEIAFASGVVSVLQVRRKQMIKDEVRRQQLYQEAAQLKVLAQMYNVTLVINDDIDLAERLGVGVHLGQGDGSVQEARLRLGDTALIGRTCHQSLDLVDIAKCDGASYAALGAVFRSSTKPQASIVSPSRIKEGCDQGIDICVIGGITALNVRQMAGLPIKYIAVVSDILNVPCTEVALRCQAWQRSLQDWWEG